MAGTIGLRMHVASDVLEHEHDAVAAENGPEIATISIASFVQHVEAQPGAIEFHGGGQIVDDEEG